ncbi:OmpP1/FadL family transporter [Novosphingobium naphthalenivorans]|uniref:OmpP1/FadL family transporter n=1 Tax=Novosphingobium naphthalenivorans TaxID=273168 RepID=UPI000A4F4862|nr:outer membrane protein transport protein [Novosphingobium naphthalenivorans]
MHKINKTSALCRGAAMALACCLPFHEAHATDVFDLEGYGATSRAMGGTAVAQDTGPAGILVNPATLSLGDEGSQVMVGLDLITTNITATDMATGETAVSRSHGANRGPYYAPEIAFSLRKGRLAFGVGAFAQGGLGTEYGKNSFLSRATGNLATGLPNSSRLLELAVPVAISYDITDKLSIGASIEGRWQALNLDLLLGADQVGSLIGAGRVDGTLVPVLAGLPDLRGAHFSLTRNQVVGGGVRSLGVGERIGLVYRPAPGTVIGLSWTPKTQMADMKGGATLTAVDGIVGQVPLTGSIRIRNFQLPQHIDAGISQQITPRLRLAVDVSEVFWKDVMANIDVGFVADNGATINILLPQGYKNQTIVALGAAYKLNDKWTLRAGGRFADQALPSSTLFAVIPATPNKHLSFGFGRKLGNRGEINFAYSHGFAPTLRNTSLPNTSAPIAVTHAQNNFVLDYRFGF